MEWRAPRLSELMSDSEIAAGMLVLVLLLLLSERSKASFSTRASAKSSFKCPECAPQIERSHVKIMRAHIVDIEDGCGIVTFIIPVSVADAIFTSADKVFTSQQEDALQAASVLWLKCRGHTIFVKTEKSHAETQGT